MEFAVLDPVLWFRARSLACASYGIPRIEVLET